MFRAIIADSRGERIMERRNATETADVVRGLRRRLQAAELPLSKTGVNSHDPVLIHVEVLISLCEASPW